jgi:Cu(I)/Ag(I) efflux system membrane fusion protein
MSATDETPAEQPEDGPESSGPSPEVVKEEPQPVPETESTVQELESKLRRLRLLGIALIALVGVSALWAGLMLGHRKGSREETRGTPSESAGESKPTTWTCSMHPQIQSSEPGLCPICGMELIPVSPGGTGGPRVLELSPAAATLAEIETARVERRDVAHEIRMVGKVDFDETRLSYITAWFPGRLDRLYVDYTGTLVRKDDHLVDIYSPELLSAQEELIQALEAQRKLQGGSQLLRETSDRTVVSAREKLRLWGLGQDQIQAIERTGQSSDHVTVRAPIGGIVVHKNKNTGDYVKTGERVYTIADLNQVWVKLDAYESDLSWIRYGQRVTFETEAYPGQPFEGRVVLVDPVLDEATRTVKLRLNVDNRDGRLKPGMFVRAVVRTRLTEVGKAMDPALAGKWICPMHGEVVKDEQGTCDICGMPLVRAESLHRVASPIEELPLVVPVSAVLWTGTRSVVYVRLAGDTPRFEGREVTIGPRSGDYFVVHRGLKEGEEVVTEGAFKIDSALQIQARPSMMLPQAPTPQRVAAPIAAVRALSPTYAAYEEVRRALAADDLAGAKAAAGRLVAATRGVDLSLFTERASKAVWVAIAARVRTEGEALTAADSIAAARRAFAGVSRQVVTLERRLGHASEGAHHELFCAMAFDGEGGSWLQRVEEVSNPYYGASMLRCGEVRESFQPVDPQRPAQPTRQPTPQPTPEATPTETPASRPTPAAVHPVAHQLGQVWAAYLSLQQALADDDPSAAQAAARDLKARLGGVTPGASERAKWDELRAPLERAADQVAASAALDDQRAAFERASAALGAVFTEFGHQPGRAVRRFHCPMAFGGRGADWLQEDARTLNPYFGKRMLRCGRQTAELPAGGGR